LGLCSQPFFFPPFWIIPSHFTPPPLQFGCKTFFAFSFLPPKKKKKKTSFFFSPPPFFDLGGFGGCPPPSLFSKGKKFPPFFPLLLGGTKRLRKPPPHPCSSFFSFSSPFINVFFSFFPFFFAVGKGSPFVGFHFSSPLFSLGWAEMSNWGPFGFLFFSFPQCGNGAWCPLQQGDRGGKSKPFFPPLLFGDREKGGVLPPLFLVPQKKLEGFSPTKHFPSPFPPPPTGFNRPQAGHFFLGKKSEVHLFFGKVPFLFPFPV